MKKEQLISQVAVLLLVALPAVLAKVGEAGSGKRVTKQVHTKGAVVESDSDHNTAETGFGAAGIGGHGKYFQDFYMIKSGPDQIEFGHVCEDPHEWEQRYEKKDLAKHRHQGQVATRSRRRGTSNRSLLSLFGTCSDSSLRHPYLLSGYGIYWSLTKHILTCHYSSHQQVYFQLVSSFSPCPLQPLL
ncbi:hypothetical protein ANN_10997 [Periplaneta americana]|uniref:Secreted protein n=1 Tax=Periplaneta americana TaxID=6978 RepID=A0ABQ8T3S6_PERAM|nr:hypothetical protein ANN_10997 [Periplaneta americana]